MNDALVNRIKKARNISFSFLILFAQKKNKGPFGKSSFLTLFAWKIHPFYVFNSNSFVSTQTRWQHYRYWLMLLHAQHIVKNITNEEKRKIYIPFFALYFHEEREIVTEKSSIFAASLSFLSLVHSMHIHFINTLSQEVFM